jgi:L-threonylcarbamoyladenylate synthase
MERLSKRANNLVKNAAKVIKEGNLVAFPTETVYGLGGDATNEKAVRRIYQVKGRPTDHPLIVHLFSSCSLGEWAKEIPKYAHALAREFWPGPMTLILKRSDLVKDFISGGQNNVGLRVPRHPVALALLKEFEELGGHGIAAPSANRFGALSPTTAKAVKDELKIFFNEKDLVLDGGKCSIGIESTIVDCTASEPRILRSGAITKKMIELVCDTSLSKNTDRGKIRIPGLLKSHYAPKAKVVLGSVAKKGDGLIALAHMTTPNGVIRLSKPTTITEFAQNFYAALRAGDDTQGWRISRGN